MTKCLRSVCALFSLVAMTSACENGGLKTPTGPTLPIPDPPSGSTGPSRPVRTCQTVSWAEISEEARELIIKHNLEVRMGEGPGLDSTLRLKRWPDESFPLTIWADVGTPEDLVAVVEFWQHESEGCIILEIVERREEAKIVLDKTWPSHFPTTSCAGGTTRVVNGVTIVSAIAHFTDGTRPGCTRPIRETMAHEVGHFVLPSTGHNTTGDIMDVTTRGGFRMSLSPLTKEILALQNSFPAGTTFR